MREGVGSRLLAIGQSSDWVSTDTNQRHKQQASGRNSRKKLLGLLFSKQGKYGRGKSGKECLESDRANAQRRFGGGKAANFPRILSQIRWDRCWWRTGAHLYLKILKHFRIEGEWLWISIGEVVGKLEKFLGAEDENKLARLTTRAGLRGDHSGN